MKGRVRVGSGSGLLLATFGLVACEPAPFSALPDSGTLGWGSSFGECIGYCREELWVTEHQTQLRVTGWHPTDPPPPRTSTVPTSPGTWRTLQRVVEVGDIHDLHERYGCPDCTDGGAEWIEVESDGQSKRVEFEYGHPPPEIRGLVEQLRAPRDEVRAQDT